MGLYIHSVKGEALCCYDMVSDWENSFLLSDLLKLWMVLACGAFALTAVDTPTLPSILSVFRGDPAGYFSFTVSHVYFFC